MAKTIRKYDKILGVRIDGTRKVRLLRNLAVSLKKFDQNPAAKPIFVTTPNPEQVVLAQKDLVFAKILNSADISVPDGIGLFAAKKFLQLPRPKNVLNRLLVLFVRGLGVGFSVLFDRKWLLEGAEVVRGREMFLDLVALANKKSLPVRPAGGSAGRQVWRVFLLGNKEKSAQKAAKNLRIQNSKLRIFGESGPMLDQDANPVGDGDRKIEEQVIEKINKVKPHVLFVGFGAPKQEKWLYRHLPDLSIGVAMVVGGTFDYVSGKKPLPPKWIENLSLEWFWRLSTGDQKWSRVKVAVLEFPLRVFWNKLTKPS